MSFSEVLRKLKKAISLVGFACIEISLLVRFQGLTAKPLSLTMCT